MLTATYADCLAHQCPCAGPEYPGADHRCPPDPRTIDEREEARYAAETGVHIGRRQ